MPSRKVLRTKSPFHEHACQGAMSASSSNEGRWEVQTQTDRVD